MAQANPNYAHLLAAGVTSAQIRAAINNGLNPAQLPPEYFGLSGGYTPAPVGPGASPSPSIGGIEFPPASMADPYATPTPSQGSMVPSVGGNMQFQNGLPNWDFYPPVSGYVAPDYYTPNTGGSMDLGEYGGYQPSGLDLYGSPIDYGYLPSSSQYGWTAPDYSSNYSYDPSAYGMAGSGELGYYEPSPIPYSDPGGMNVGGDMTLGGYGGTDYQQPDSYSGLFDPLPTDYSDLGTPGSGSDAFAGATAEGDPGSGVDPFAGSSADGYINAGVDSNGTATPYTMSGYSVPLLPAPPGGVFQMGTYIPGGSSTVAAVGPSGYSLIGVPGTYVTTGSGSTYSTHVGTSMDPFQMSGGGGGLGSTGLGEQPEKSLGIHPYSWAWPWGAHAFDVAFGMNTTPQSDAGVGPGIASKGTRVFSSPK